MELEKDFREFIELLNENQVKYLVVGGYAVNYHGYPRFTKDIDFWIWMSEENSKKLLTTIDKFGFGSLGLVKDDFLTPDNIIQLGYAPYRIDLILNVDGVDFDKCYNNRIETEMDGVKINFISLQDLIIAKNTSKRLQDLADAEELEKIKDRNDDKKNIKNLH